MPADGAAFTPLWRRFGNTWHRTDPVMTEEKWFDLKVLAKRPLPR